MVEGGEGFGGLGCPVKGWGCGESRDFEYRAGEVQDPLIGYRLRASIFCRSIHNGSLCMIHAKQDNTVFNTV